MPAPFRIEALSAMHDRSRFASGSEPLDRYFRQQVGQDIKRKLTSCFVAVATAGGQIAGCYTLAAASIAVDALTADLVKKLPHYPAVPAALLGRLAIAQPSQNQGLGSALLADALMRCVRAELGVFALPVEAKDEAAMRFYDRHGFTRLAGETQRMLLPIATALRLQKP